MTSKRKVFYRQIAEIKPLRTSSDVLCSLISFEDGGFARFIDSRIALASSVIREGTAVSVTDSAVRMRRLLGLPFLEFDSRDIGKIVEKTGLLKILERSR